MHNVLTKGAKGALVLADPFSVYMLGLKKEGGYTGTSAEELQGENGFKSDPFLFEFQLGI